MAKYCSNCGNEIDENAIVCVKCGCAVNDSKPAAKEKTPFAAIILGILGIIFAWLFALAGHVLSIIGIVIGAFEYKRTRKMHGLVLSIIGELCAIASSVLGVIISLNM